MDHLHHHHTRLVGDYILGPRIGSGSFAVVWLSRHRNSGTEVAVKEIDKKLLSPKVSESLLKEISILSTINHPNIIRLFESIENEDRIFLVLEYCDGGDLAAYVHRHGKVSEAVARHFMRQLAAGLQVLQENHLIHRDLKPQNLLLSSNEETPRLKIGDFGFARSLTPQDLADTLCGSPLYMAPEIIQNQKYDAKADLWSVGAILFQLVTGKPPFDGNSQYQLFQNILTSTELRFPQGALEELHPDCLDLCRSLLRQNPVERLTFKEFFNHKFLGEPRLEMDPEQESLVQETKSVVEQLDSSGSDERSLLHSEHPMHSTGRNAKLSSSFVHDDVVHAKVHGSISGTESVHSSLPIFAHDRTRRMIDGSQCPSDHHRVADSAESIERDYVLVNCHFGSMENLSYYSETSLQGNSTTRVFVCPPKKNNQDVAVAPLTKQCAASSVDSAKNPVIYGSDPLAASRASTILMEVQGQSRLTPSASLHLLNRYVQAVAELAQEKHNAGLFLESFSVELVVLAIWKKALHICNSWLASSAGSELPESSSANESNPDHGGRANKMDLDRPSSACKWAEQEFVAAYNRAEKLSDHISNMDAAAQMPDAMEIIFQKALAVGTSAATSIWRTGAVLQSLTPKQCFYFLLLWKKQHLCH
ncbi:serine/threonine-protein kinase ATG1a isoform X2 [Ricinus communis]|uniref:serine/threonine-protein kinase ATG1a isoform X2 n=1 Tax=Ricinus communis TaxID=3988 RepID=UPI00201AFB78|nr:serine/threonine-protein kinase ATG1a isoform X2 [Ricinus communis]